MGLGGCMGRLNVLVLILRFNACFRLARHGIRTIRCSLILNIGRVFLSLIIEV